MTARRTGHQLYRLFGYDGELLYIGSCSSWSRRLNQHAALQPWGDDIAKVTIERYKTKPEALAAERAAIAAERPIHNTQGVSPRRPYGALTRLVVDALIEHGPMTQTELERLLGRTSTSTTVLRLYDQGVLVVVGEKPSATNRHVSARLFGVVEARTERAA